NGLRRSRLGGGDSRSLFRCNLFPGGHRLDFGQAVAGAGVEIEGVELLQVANAFQQVAQGHVVILGERLEDFENALFHAHAGLDALDEEMRFIGHGTNVPWYVDSAQIPPLRKRRARVGHPSASALFLRQRAGLRVRILFPAAPLFSIFSLPCGLSMVSPSAME